MAEALGGAPGPRQSRVMTRPGASAPGGSRTRRVGASSRWGRRVIAPISSVRSRSAGAVTATSIWSSSAPNGRSESRLKHLRDQDDPEASLPTSSRVPRG